MPRPCVFFGGVPEAQKHHASPPGNSRLGLRGSLIRAEMWHCGGGGLGPLDSHDNFLAGKLGNDIKLWTGLAIPLFLLHIKSTVSFYS